MDAQVLLENKCSRYGRAHATGSVYWHWVGVHDFATDSADFDAGDWYWQAVATKGQLKIDSWLRQFDCRGKPLVTQDSAHHSFDGRTQAQKDLEAVQTAIRT